MESKFLYSSSCNEKEKIVKKLSNVLYKNTNIRDCLNIVFLCIGTDRMTGDSFGPLVGTKLKQQFEKNNIWNINVYGTLEENVSYKNITYFMDLINKRHYNSLVIAIDSALSSKENIGKVFIEEQKLELGKSLNKKKIEIGDVSIKAVVGKNYKLPKYNFNVLQNISLNDVFKLVNIVSDGIIDTIKFI